MLDRYLVGALIGIVIQFGSLNMAYSQNLVPNGSFEEYFNCPTSMGNLEVECLNWYASLIPADDLQPTPDWFHSCSEIDFLAPPDVALGYQVPADGDGYAGLITFQVAPTTPNYREIIGVELNEILAIGSSYLVELKISSLQPNNSYVVNDKIGFNFSTHPTYHKYDFPINHSHFAIDTIVSFSNEWSQISVVFEADSAYRYLHIGNFYDDLNTNVIVENEFAQVGYYVFDDVRVSQVLSTSENNLSPAITVYPNPAHSSIQIKTQSELRDATVSIYSATGNKVFEEYRRNWATGDQIDVTLLESGVYMLNLRTSEVIYNGRFIKL